MAGVFIDIPGVGNVEAKNAATEATLREILKAIKGGGLGGSRGTGPTSGMTGSGGGGSSAAGGGGSGMLSKSLGGLSKGLGAVSVGAGMVWKGFNAVAASATNLIQELANVGDSLTSAAGALKNIPVVGGLLSGILGAVAQAAESTVGAFQDAAKSGATFGGSVNEFAAASSKAGMTMKDFASVINNNRDAMLAFGGTSESGAKNFANVSKTLRATSSDLYALGFSTKDINEGLGKYGSLLRAQGLQGNKTNAELAAGAKNYMKELDLLAKATGQSRAEIEARQAALAKDAQFQAAMAGASEDVRKSFMAVASGMPKELETFTKDILANGTATTEENAKLLSQLPQSAAMLRNMQAKMARGEAVTLEERNALNNLMKEEGARNLKNIKQAGAASAELSGTVNALAATQQINTDALAGAAADQKNATEKTDKMAEQVEKAKASLAAFSNSFQMALANSGLLDVLMESFSALANFTMQYVVPAFNVIAAVVRKVWEGFTILLAPVIESVSGLFGEGGLGGTIQMIDDVMNAVFPVLSAIVRQAILVFEGLWSGVQQLIDPIKRLFGLFGELGGSSTTLTDTLLLAGDIIGGMFEFLGAAVGAVIDGFTWLVTTVKNVINKSEWLTSMFASLGNGVSNAITTIRKYLSAEGFKSMLEGLTDGFMGMIDSILNMLPDWANGISDEEKKKRDDERKLRKEARDARLDAALEERNDKLKAAKEGVKADTEKFTSQRLHVRKMGGLQKEEEDAKKKAAESAVIKDYNDPLAMLKAEAKQQKSGLIPAEIKNAKTASPELAGSVKALEAQAAADKKSAEDAKNKAVEEAKVNAPKTRPAGASQESAETLLASLNTKLDQLIKVNRDSKELAEAQLSVQKGLTGNLLVSA